MSAFSDAIPKQVLDAYGIELDSAKPAASGLINRTWIVETASAERLVIQCLHTQIPAQVNDSIRVVTGRLRDQDVCTPLLVETCSGDTYAAVGDKIWRVLTYVPGISFDVVPDVGRAREAGGILARFHGAFINWTDMQAPPVSTVHNLPRHLGVLRTALANGSEHDQYPWITELAEEILSFAQSLPQIIPNTPRIVHGDPKISNILFEETGGAVCLVDLDTVGFMDLVWELGDAFRSWCNPHGEDTEDTTFSLDLLHHALSGYAAYGPRFITQQEVAGTVSATLTIYTELAARFCADALSEGYFAWDPERFSSRAEHNLVRATGQLNAAKDLAKKRIEAERIAAQIFAAQTR